jgi:RNA polymerase sigma-70 factor (ECF subfamily)
MAQDTHGLGALLERSRAGDQAAWNTLLQRLRPYVRLLLQRQACNDGEASDLVQEAQLRMHRGFDQFWGAQVPQFLAWVRQIVVRTLADHAARRPRQQMLLPDLPDRRGASVEADLLRDEEMTLLAEALEQLSADYRMVIEARLLAGLKCVEIARRSGHTPEWVRVTCKRAIEELRRRLRTKP